ncbi:hypothetical protein BDZ97DRAFT_2055271 [Flammula alnicola]|nr:hypothetical protein BDZ97DRAFT_2055271 [Flammula alnicola]
MVMNSKQDCQDLRINVDLIILANTYFKWYAFCRERETIKSRHVHGFQLVCAKTNAPNNTKHDRHDKKSSNQDELAHTRQGFQHGVTVVKTSMSDSRIRHRVIYAWDIDATEPRDVAVRKRPVAFFLRTFHRSMAVVRKFSLTSVDLELASDRAELGNLKVRTAAGNKLNVFKLQTFNVNINRRVYHTTGKISFLHLELRSPQTTKMERTFGFAGTTSQHTYTGSTLRTTESELAQISLLRTHGPFGVVAEHSSELLEASFPQIMLSTSDWDGDVVIGGNKFKFISGYSVVQYAWTPDTKTMYRSGSPHAQYDWFSNYRKGTSLKYHHGRPPETEQNVK